MLGPYCVPKVYLWEPGNCTSVSMVAAYATGSMTFLILNTHSTLNFFIYVFSCVLIGKRASYSQRCTNRSNCDIYNHLSMGVNQIDAVTHYYNAYAHGFAKLQSVCQESDLSVLAFTKVNFKAVYVDEGECGLCKESKLRDDCFSEKEKKTHSPCCELLHEFISGSRYMK